MSRLPRRRAGLALAAVLVAVLAACSPTTTRPAITPMPASPNLELKGKPTEIAERMLAVLERQGVPLARSSVKDAYAESPWLDGSTFEPTTRRPIGTETVKLRAWVDPGRPNYSVVTLETVYRLAADPSVPQRELDRPVPQDHPARPRMQALLDSLKTAR